MTVYVFIIESANTEVFDQSFLNREIDDVLNPSFILKMSIDNFDKMTDTVSKTFRDNIVTFLIDEQYHVKYYYTNQGEKELKKIESLKSNQVKFYACNWYEFKDNFDGLDDTNNYVFVTAENYENIYDMANFLQLPVNSNCYFLWNCYDILDCCNAASYYNIFSSIPRMKQIDSLGGDVIIDPLAIEWIIEYGVRQVQGLIKAGCLKKEAYVQSYVDPWVLNPHSYFSKGIIIEYDLKPKAPLDGDKKILKGLTVTEQFNEDAEYRYQITDKMCRILCKYGLEFGRITTINNDTHSVNFELLLD